MLGLVSMFTLCAAVATANAQLTYPVRAKVPFDFSIGNKKLQAGQYTFSRLSTDNRIILVSNVDDNTSVFQSTLGAQVLAPQNESKLVFHRYGDQYFLEQIWTAGEREGTEVPESRSERSVRQQLAKTYESNLSRKVTKVEKTEIISGLF